MTAFVHESSYIGDLHTAVYRDILAGGGIGDARGTPASTPAERAPSRRPTEASR